MKRWVVLNALADAAVASALKRVHSQSLCASEEGNGSLYVEKKCSSTVGTVETVIMCCGLA